MSVSDLDAQIDALYQLPPAGFTAARTALAKTLTGQAARHIKQLKKPTIVPWAVNQLYWNARPVYQRLLQRGQALRAAQLAALEGRTADVHRAAEAHRQAIAEAIRRAVELAAAADLKPDAEPLGRMFEALSLAPQAPSRAGRFSETLQPAGFEALAGVTPAGRPTRPHDDEPYPTDGSAKRPPADQATQRRLERRAQLERRNAESALKTANRALEHARRAEARASRALALAEADVRSATESVAMARTRLERSRH
jgi:hypothetical protein